MEADLALDTELLQNVDRFVEELGLVRAALARQRLDKGGLAQMKKDIDNVAEQLARAEAVLFLVLDLR